MSSDSVWISASFGPNETMTAGAFAVGASSKAKSFPENSFGTTYTRHGIMRRMMIGKPIAAIVCEIAIVRPKNAH